MEKQKSADGRKRSRIWIAVIGFLAVAAVVGSMEDEDGTESSAPVQTTAHSPAEPNPAETDRGFVQRSDFGVDWPLLVDSGTLRCDGSAVTLDDGNRVYAINGMATTRGMGIDVDPIWADNPDIPGTKKNIGELVDRGLELCD